MRTRANYGEKSQRKSVLFHPSLARYRPQRYWKTYGNRRFLHVYPLSPCLGKALCIPLALLCCFYCMICHSCSLRTLGMKARSVGTAIASPIETDIDKHLSACSYAWYADELAIEPLKSLLSCSISLWNTTRRSTAAVNCIGFWGLVPTLT